jgi:MFS transporter, Spinster family, sphingosine-1-phosphate transporter
MKKPSASAAPAEAGCLVSTAGSSDESGSPSVPVRVAWTVVALLWVTYLLNYVDRQVVFSIFPALQSELGFTSAQLGWIGSIFIWVYSLSNPLVGRLADVVRRDHIIIASLVLWSLATAATGLAKSVDSFLFWRGVMGITEGLYVPAALGMIGMLHGPATRSRALAIHGTAQFLGIVLGGWFGGWMADRVGWRPGFAILAAVGLLYAPALWRYFRGLPYLHPPRTAAQSSPGDIFGARCYWGLLLAFFFFCLVLWMLYAWLPNFIYEKYRLSMAESGLNATLYLQTFCCIGVIGGGALADWLVRRVPAARFYMLACGLILCSPFAYLTLAVDSLALLRVASGAFGFFAGLAIANVFAASYDVISERNFSFGAGVLNMIGGLAGGAGALLAGQWKESIGIVALMQWSTGAAILSAAVLVLVTRKNFGRDYSRARTTPAPDPS